MPRTKKRGPGWSRDDTKHRRDAMRRRRQEESDAARAVRLQKDKVRHRKRRDEETDEEKATRLQYMRERLANRRIKEMEQTKQCTIEQQLLGSCHMGKRKNDEESASHIMGKVRHCSKEDEETDEETASCLQDSGERTVNRRNQEMDEARWCTVEQQLLGMACVAENDISRSAIVGWGSDLPSQASLSQLSSSECVTRISSSSRHSAVVCASGRVYTLGRNDYHGWMKKDMINEPTLVKELVSYVITQTACGVGSTFFLTDLGLLFSSGWNVFGQLGLGNTIDSPSPTLLRGLLQVKKVAAGDVHTVVLTESGEILACGCNCYGQLGLGHVDNTSTFTRVSYLTDTIIDVSCGSFFTALLTSSGDLLMAGSNGLRQLGLLTGKKWTKFEPVSLQYTFIVAVVCGSNHTAALAEDGTVWAWGHNMNGQLGIDLRCKKSTPRKMVGLKNYTISSMFAGCDHTAFRTQQGDVIVCGCGQSGELGSGTEDICAPIVLKKSSALHLQQIVFGDGYSLLLVSLEPALPTVGTQTDSIVRSPVTNWEKTVLKVLKCPVCFKMMSAPIRQCCNGHALCESCYSSQEGCTCPTCHGEFICTRNSGLEFISSHIHLPRLA